MPCIGPNIASTGGAAGIGIKCTGEAGTKYQGECEKDAIID